MATCEITRGVGQDKMEGKVVAHCHQFTRHYTMELMELTDGEIIVAAIVQSWCTGGRQHVIYSTGNVGLFHHHDRYFG